MIAAEEIVLGALGSRYTAAVLRVQHRGTCAYERAFGHIDATPDARAIDVTTAFDLASLTKVFVSTAVLAAVSEGLLSLDDSLLAYFPEWIRTAHAPITPRMLLAHRAGMASGAFYRTLFGEDVERFACMRPLEAIPGARVVYSDLGYIALGTLLARVRTRGLPAVVAATCAALACENTRYRSRNDAPWRVPATECDAWRGRVHGYVHDEKAYFMNGAAGHAGLFGTAADVARLAEAYLAAIHGRPCRALSPELAREAVREHGSDDVLRRGLGWALKTSDDNSCGARTSMQTFGHTGFTGTVVWADPARDLSIVLLTNAVYFGRHDLRDVRAAVCDAVVAEFAA